MEKKPHLGCAGWGKRLRDAWNSLALEYGVENGDGIPTGSINSLPAPEFHPEIPKKPQPIPNYPVAGMGWNFLPKFPGISPPNRERMEPKTSSFREKMGILHLGMVLGKGLGAKSPHPKKNLGKEAVLGLS